MTNAELVEKVTTAIQSAAYSSFWPTEDLRSMARAAITIVLEEAAKVAEARDLSIMSSTVVDIEARKIAAAIRAMKE